MTNLSKELCEICGIKPRYGVYQNFGALDDNYRLVTNARKCRLIADSRFYVDDEDLRDLQAIYYPDFAQAENFVKLLNFYYRFFQGVDICAFEDEVRELEARGEQISIQNDFLAMLIFDLQNREHGFNLDINFEVFTQAIRETEWVYG